MQLGSDDQTRGLREAPRVLRYHHEFAMSSELTHPAADYWNEHHENFAAMLKDLMRDETFKSVLGEASKTSLKWNHLKVR